MRRRWTIVALVVAAILLWSPLLKPAGQAAILIGDIFTEQLIGTNLAAAVTPEPRMVEDDDSFAGTPMRVTYWRPGWGDQHPAIMIVPGAAPRGNDEPILRSFGRTLARAGYLVMLPEFPFLKEGRFDSTSARQIAAAFAHARALPDTRERNVGAFGVSVGAGLMLVAAAREPALREAAFLAVLGGYYDIDTYLASLASRTQPTASGPIPWEPSQEVQERLPRAALDVVPASARDAVRAAIEPASYEVARGRIRAPPAEARSAMNRCRRSPCEEIGHHLWIHDPLDTFSRGRGGGRARRLERDACNSSCATRSHAAPTGERPGAGTLYVAGACGGSTSPSRSCG